MIMKNGYVYRVKNGVTKIEHNRRYLTKYDLAKIIILRRGIFMLNGALTAFIVYKIAMAFIWGF